MGTLPDLATLASWRQGAYRLMATLSSRPDPQTANTLPAAAAMLRENAPWLAYFSFAPSWLAMSEVLESTSPADVADLLDEYSSLFVSGRDGSRVWTTQSAYLDRSDPSSVAVLAQLDATIRRAGFEPAAGRRTDELDVQLEFVSVACSKEAECWEAEAKADALRWLRLQHDVLAGHLSRWVPLVARGVRSRARDGFYAPVMTALEDLVIHDADFTGSLARSDPLSVEVIG